MKLDNLTVQKYSISQIFEPTTKIIFEIPKYQREYVWGTREWEALFDDFWESDGGIYLGSIICISNSIEIIKELKLEVVDGQQRLTTLSILFCAFYSFLNNHSELLDEDQRSDLLQLKRKIVLNNNNSLSIRIVPQIQNNNQGDYYGLLSDIELIPKRKVPTFAKNRRIFKAYNYFYNRFEKIKEKEEGDLIAVLFNMLEKINSAIIIMTTVSSHSDAYTLFESLNNRGLPLTSIDLIKNLLLSKLDNTNENLSGFFEQWIEILNNLGDDYTNQERFFRHNYNAFRKAHNEPFLPSERQYPLGSIATRSTLLDIYEKIIIKNPQKALEELLENSFIYSTLLLYNKEDLPSEQYDCYLDLQRVQGAPSYLLLLYLLKNQQELQLVSYDIIKICRLLVSFFIRRNLTDIPPTRDIDRIFMKFIEEVENNRYIRNEIYDNLRRVLIGNSATTEFFENKLRGPVYESNVGVTRFILCMMAEQNMTRENKQNLWEKSNNKYIWTIEHIFPKGEKIPKWWVDMIASGNYEQAKAYQEEFVHTLGNLTITGYNSSLSNKPFKEKKECKDANGNYIGFLNGLSLNADIITSDDKWTIEKIKARTDSMVKEILKLFEL